jgi:murein DD-endopeptidase MepM/ murein hydrolase activator NlpD
MACHPRAPAPLVRALVAGPGPTFALALALALALASTACFGGFASLRTRHVATPLSEGNDADESSDAAAHLEDELAEEDEDLGFEDRVARVLTRGRDAAEGQGGAADPLPARQLRRVRIEGSLPDAPASTEPDRLDLPSHERFAVPVAEPSVTSGYGMRRDPLRPRRRRMHRGVDYRGEPGTPVYATASGRAVMAGWCDRGTGNCIVLDHPHGWRSQYFHLSRVRIANGDWVEQGQHIGDIGSTGRSTGPHLHFQLGRDGHAVDPEELYGTPLAQ